MDVLKPAAQPAALALAPDRAERAAPSSAAAPRADLPPVTRMGATSSTAPRPPDQLGLGLVQAARLADTAPASPSDPAPKGTLKPWGIAILPDSEAIAARREAEAEAETNAEAARQDEARVSTAHASEARKTRPPAPFETAPFDAPPPIGVETDAPPAPG
ncbi:hypothetical protein [Limimaricola litoreus]|uniref:Uncharacterized protein n=1 Tax=Limimaricola litoreus TaxID=2955316 RepID=A0A9X2FYW4_9RHOB|nr:hypothetical protein [Limimaricola litoreus]MCP1170048.1 hypothetical protein [Limimaricola litoreus]